MKQLRRTIGNERGVAVPMFAVALLAIVGFTGLGVDIGRLGVVADEVQTAADVAATAAALQFVNPGHDTATPRQSAEAVLSQNEINNTAIASSNLTLLEFGNFTDGTFTADLPPINAARARVDYTVNNLVFGGLGHPTSLVTKESIAAFSPAGAGRPTFPITVGDCLLNEDCTEDSCQPTLTQIPNPEDNSAWIGFFDGASTSTIGGFFPSECGGDPSTVPLISVGDMIDLLNGQSTDLLRLIDDCINAGITEALVPVTECGGALNQAREVIGFASFELLSVQTSNKGGGKGITIRGLTSTDDGPAGGEQFGSGTVSLVH